MFRGESCRNMYEIDEPRKSMTIDAIMDENGFYILINVWDDDEYLPFDWKLSKSAPTTTTSTGNAAVIIVNICKYAIWDWHDQSLVLSKIRNDIAKWTILFSQMVYITLQYRLYHFVISSILQCCQYTLTTLLIYFCNQLRLLSKQNCVRCWLFQNLLLLHFNQSFHLFRTIPAIILILKFAATLPPIFWNALFMGKNGWQ